jgi:CBS domain containing-hemolysin-like protein
MSDDNFFTRLFHRHNDNPNGLSNETREMIANVREFGKTTVKEIMVPRTDTVFIQVDAPRAQSLDAIADREHSRFPVYEDTIDNVIGVVYVKDILKRLIQQQDFSMRDILHPAMFVPESKHIDALFSEFQTKHLHIAIVVDEYGGVSGIVSMEDILEEIVGDIQDEFDDEKEDIVESEPGVFLCDGRVNLDDLGKRIAFKFPIEEEFDTLGGFLFDLFGKIPAPGDSAHYSADGVNLDFLVQDIDDRRIDSVVLTRAPAEGPDEEEA